MGQKFYMSGAITLDEAYARCSELAQSHYENFPVARMVPKHMRRHVAAVYAFARTADDIADEEHESIAEDDPIRVEHLREFESQLDVEDAAKLDPKWSWIFLALANTIREYEIPKQLFRDLISAFAQDVVQKRYATFSDVLDYCRRSANPVGRLVLILHGYKDDELYVLSDHICTALQLANFWQDMSVDRGKNRIYVPQEDWGGLTEAEIFADTETALRYSVSPRILFETAVMKAAMPSADYDIEALIARVDALEKKLAKGNFSSSPAIDAPQPDAD